MPLPPELLLESHDGLALAWRGGDGRIRWHHPDWLGTVHLLASARPCRAAAAEEDEGADDLGTFRRLSLRWAGLALPLVTSVRAYADQPLLVFRVEATSPIAGLASGRFERPSVAWPWLRPDRRLPEGLPEGSSAVGHLYTEFAIPAFSDASLTGFPTLDEPPRPAVVEPLWLIAPEGRCLLLAPLDSFHEQVIAVPRGPAEAERGVACGWHGDLDTVPAGFASELAILAGRSPRALLERWGGWLRRRSGMPARSRYADPVLSHLSYWTDNGAAYWYRTEPGLDMPATLERTIAHLRAGAVPIRAVELDSWFYPHAKTRPLNPDRATTFHRRAASLGSRARTCSPRESLRSGTVSELRRSSCMDATSRAHLRTSRSTKRGVTATVPIRRTASCSRACSRKRAPGVPSSTSRTG